MVVLASEVRFACSLRSSSASIARPRLWESLKPLLR
jgi:hypothetical protein